MKNAIPLSIKFSIKEEENTDIIISFVAAIKVAVNTEEPVTPVAPTKMVINDADTVLVSVHAIQINTVPHILLNSPAFTIYPVIRPHKTLTMEYGR